MKNYFKYELSNTKKIRTGILLTLLLQGIISFGQKTYEINKSIWTYTTPANYKIRIDNFSSAINKGDSVIRQNTTLSEQSNDEHILLSIGKSDSSDINIILADYKDNSNIKKFTMKGYITQLVQFMKYNFEKLGSDVNITTKEIFIDKIKFSVVETRIYHKENNYAYWTAMYIADLSNKEFSISVTYDNEKDKKAIEQSILKSKFVIR